MNLIPGYTARARITKLRQPMRNRYMSDRQSYLDLDLAFCMAAEDTMDQVMDGTMDQVMDGAMAREGAAAPGWAAAHAMGQVLPDAVKHTGVA
jgi:hypothetical protein